MQLLEQDRQIRIQKQQEEMMQMSNEMVALQKDRERMGQLKGDYER